ncbi:MAG: efflux RND transporter permease subunit [Armatimonadetes bacterium]|nr:efflux RND transporter permease subunit [Armatimonadota bacterium]
MSLADATPRLVKPIVFTALLLSVVGGALYLSFPVSILPDVTFPRVVVIAEAGERPTRMVEVTVTRPIEEAISTLPDVKRIRSKTQRGSTEISVDFADGADMVVAEQLVNGRVNQVRPELPADTRTEVERMNATVFPVMGLSLASATMTQSELWGLATYSLRPRLARVEGVARVVVQGGRAPEIAVEVDPRALATYHLSTDDVVAAIAKANAVRSIGLIERSFQQMLVMVDGQSASMDEVAEIAVAQRDGTPILVRQIARLSRSTADRTTVVSANGRESVLLNVVRQPTANSVAMVAAVNREVNALRPSLPPGADLSVFYDQSVLVTEAVANVRDAVLIGAALAVVVLLLFLGNVRATALTSAIIPVTVLITFMVMRIAGLTLNLMTLGALAVAIGLVIDDAIVVVECVFRRLQTDGVTVAEAVRRAGRDITAPMVSSTLTTVVVFLPLVLLKGVSGAFFMALAVTLVIALMVSLGLALFLSPTLCAAFLKAHDGGHGEGRVFSGLLRGYEAVLRLSVRHWWAPALLAVVSVALIIVLAPRLETGFMPALDEGSFVLDFNSAPGSSLTETDRLLSKVDAILKETPEVLTFSRRLGAEMGFAITEGNRGDYAVMPKPDHKLSTDEVCDGLRKRIAAEVPGLEVEFIQVLQDLVGDLAGNPEPIEVRLFGENQDELVELAKGLETRLGEVKGLVDVKSSAIESGPELALRPDPSRIGRIGLTTEDVASQADAALYGAVATTILQGDRQLPVRVRLPSVYRDEPRYTEAVPIRGQNRPTYPLSALGNIERRPGTTLTTREDQRRMVGVTARLEGIDLGSAVAGVRRAMQKTALPAGVAYTLGGQYLSQQEAFSNLLLVLCLAILAVYMVMLFQFGSFTAPSVILAIMPLSLAGAVAALSITGTQLNVSSFMGAIMLVGIVVKNGILLLDRAVRAEHEGVPTDEAVLAAGRERLRPILMTTLTAILGLAPLSLGIGAGSQMQQPLAITVIGGLLYSTILSLVMGPSLYALLRRAVRSVVG